MNKFKVSVCIPVYNTEKYLKRCLQSLTCCGLEENEFEIIIVDDGSKGNCKEIVEWFRGKHPHIMCKYCKHDRNLGIFETRKTGVELAKGQYIYILDSDDYLEPNAISELVDLSNNGTFDIVQGGFNEIGLEEGRIKSIPVKTCMYKESVSLLEKFMCKQVVSGYIWGKLIRREIYKKVFDILPDIYLNFMEDFLQMFFITANSKSCVSTSEPFYNYDRSSESTTNNIKFKTAEDYKSLFSYVEIRNILNPDTIKNKKVLDVFSITDINILSRIYNRCLEVNDKNELPKVMEAYKNTFGETVYNKIKTLNESK